MLEFELSGFAASAVATLALTPAAMAAARRFGVLDRPSGHKQHASPTPLLGGVAMAAAFAVGLWVASRSGVTFDPLLLIGALILLIVGWVDDLRPLGVAPKLTAQLVAVALPVAGLISQGGISRGDSVGTALVGAFFVLLLTNSFNLLDNADGVTAAVAGITALGLAAWATSAAPATAALAACLAGTAFAFLLFNRPPARVFMGDAGSLWIGYVAAGSAFALAEAQIQAGVPVLKTVTALGCLFLVPLFDTGLVSLSRLRRGKNPLTTPGRDHLAHRLRLLGFGPGAVTALIAAGAVLGGVTGRGVYLGILPAPAVAVVLAFMGTAGFVYLERVWMRAGQTATAPNSTDDPRRDGDGELPRPATATHGN